MNYIGTSNLLTIHHAWQKGDAVRSTSLLVCIQLIAITSTGTTKLYTMVVEPMLGFLVDNIYITIRYRYHHYYFYYYYAVIVFVTKMQYVSKLIDCGVENK